MGQGRDMQRLLPLSGGAPTWLNGSNAATLRQQNFLHLQPESGTAQQNDVVRGGIDRNRTESNSEPDDLAEYKADILGHPLYDQLLSAHISCLRIATPVDQLPRIDAQLQQSQRVVDKYSSLGNGVVDDKELDQFMVNLLPLSLKTYNCLLAYNFIIINYQPYSMINVFVFCSANPLSNEFNHLIWERVCFLLVLVSFFSKLSCFWVVWISDAFTNVIQLAFSYY